MEEMLAAARDYMSESGSLPTRCSRPRTCTHVRSHGPTLAALFAARCGGVCFQGAAARRDWSVTGVQPSPFLFSSRRRHTRLVSDWSSDVCSSDLIRLDQVDQAMATIVVALPFVLPLVYFMMRRLSGDEQKTS